MNDFEALMRFTDSLQEKWNKTAAKEDTRRSFTGLQSQIKAMHTFLLNEQADRESEYRKIQEDGKLTPAYIGRRRKELDERYQKAKNKVISTLEEAVRDMISDKFVRLDKMLVTAPSPDQVALLNSIKMRGKNISRGELMKMLPAFMRNYQAMRIFENLSQSAGYSVSIPLDGDICDMYALLDEGGKYLLECVNSVGKQDIHLHRAFFYDNPQAPGNADPEFQKYIDSFDVAVQLQDFTVSKGLSAADEAMISSYFSDIDELDPEKDSVTILRSVQKILHKHPEDIDKMMKSKYAQLVAEVQELELINKKKAEADEQKKAAASDK